jgi:hypothetical protein
MQSQLSGAATSAALVYRWLSEAHLALPLATCRLLLAPVPGEEIFDLPCFSTGATLDNFLEDAYGWKRDAAEDRRSTTFFYFCGQGVEIAQDPVLFFEDVGRPVGPLLRNTVQVSNLVGGMAPSSIFPDIARTQFYFVDACRSPISVSIPSYQSANSSPVFDIDIGPLDDRSAPIFYATASGGAAFLKVNEQSFFSKALIECFQGAASVPIRDEYGDLSWAISSTSLANVIQIKLDESLGPIGVQQLVTVSGALRNSIICFVEAPPLVSVVIEIDPPERAADVSLKITSLEGHGVIPLPSSVKPHKISLKAGLYSISADSAIGRSFSQTREILPPQAHWKLRVST